MKQYIQDLIYLTFVADPDDVAQRGVSAVFLLKAVLLVAGVTVLGFGILVLLQAIGIGDYPIAAGVVNVVMAVWGLVPPLIVVAVGIVYIKALKAGDV